MSLINHKLTAAQVQTLLSQGASITENRGGANALHVAASSPVEMNEKLGFLIDAGVDVNQINRMSDYDNTPLHILIANERHDAAVFFIERASQRIHYEQQDREGKTTLVTAAKINSSPIGLALLNQIPDKSPVLDVQDKDGMTALHYACLYGNSDLAHALISKGASGSILNLDGKTPMDCVVSGIAKIRDSLRSIWIDPGRDERAQSNAFCAPDGQPFCYEGQLLDAIPAKRQNIPDLLTILSLPLSDTTSAYIGHPRQVSPQEKAFIQAEAGQFTGKSVAEAAAESAARLKHDLISKGHFSGLVLRYEAALGALPNVEKLISSAPHAINECGRATLRTALHQVAIHGHMAVSDCLIANGANLSLADNDGNTALHHAVQRGHFNLAEKLVSFGADIRIKNKAGQNALATLTRPDTQAVKQRLIERQRAYEESRGNLAQTSEPTASSLTPV